MPTHIASPMASPIEILLCEDAALTGTSRSALGRRACGPQADLYRLRPGAYVRRPEWVGLYPEQRHLVRVCASRLVGNGRGASVALARESAAVVHEIPMIGRLPDTLEYVAPGGTGGQRTRVSHVLPSPQDTPVEEVHGIPVVGAVQTVVDLMRRRPFRSGLVSLDHALRQGLATKEQLLDAVASQPGCRGNERARRCIRYGSALAESVGESLSRALMIEAHIPMPDLQVSYYTQDGELVGRVDFAWPALRVVGEFDGRVKYSRGMRATDPEATAQLERQRENHLERATGMRMIRWMWKDLKESGTFLRILALAGVVPTR